MIKRFFLNLERLIKRIKVSRFFQILIVLGILMLISVGLLLSLNWFASEEKKEYIVKNFPIVRKIFPVLRNVRKISDVFYFPYYFKKSELPVYEIIIEPTKLAEMEAALPNPYSETVFTDEYQVWKKAVLKHGNKEYEIKIRYRGDNPIHWDAAKKSIKVRFTGEQYFDGISNLSFILPDDRFFVVEDFNNYRASKLGLMHPESHFGVLKINGKSHGLYFIIESWSKEFLARNEAADESNFFTVGNENVWFGRRDTPYDNLFLWRKYTTEKYHEYDDYSPVNLFIDSVNGASDEWIENNFFSLVDRDNFYNWQIHALLMNSYHQGSANLRVYYNRDDGKFYFIPWDINIFENIPGSVDVANIPFISRVLNIPEFIQERNRRLFKYVGDEENIDEDLAYYDKIYQAIGPALYQDRLKIYSNLWADSRIKEYRGIIIDNYRKIQEAFQKARAIIKIEIEPNEERNISKVLARVEVSVDNFTDVEFVDMEIPLRHGLELGSLRLYKDSNGNGQFDSGDEFLTSSFFEEGKLIFGNLEEILATRREVGLEMNTERPYDLLQTEYNYFIVSDVNSREIDWNKIQFGMLNQFTRKKLGSDNLAVRLVDGQSFRHFEQISWDENKFLVKYPFFSFRQGTFILYPGDYNINENIIIPKGFSLRIESGARLFMGEGVSVISYSPVEILGTKNLPVLITAQNKNGPWGVFAIQSASDKSIVQYAKFENGGDAYINGAYYSGMLAAHYSDIDIRSCIFDGATGDDGLNVKKSKSKISDNYFYRNNFDAIDLDWTSGEVTGNYFVGNGNDGIDIGGAINLLIQDNYVNGSGDKCLSIGEKSEQTIVFNNLFRQCVSGIAVKDNSDVKIINNTVIDNEVGIAVYEKKPVFGGAKPTVYNSIIHGNGEQITLDKKSIVEVFYSNIEGGWNGIGNVDIFPGFYNGYISDELGGDVAVIKEILNKEYQNINFGIIGPVLLNIPF